MERTERIAELQRELPYVEVIDLTREIAVLAGRIFGDLYWIGQQIGTADALIAATALHHAITLVTGNGRHFERIQLLGYPLLIEDWELKLR